MLLKHWPIIENSVAESLFLALHCGTHEVAIHACYVA